MQRSGETRGAGAARRRATGEAKEGAEWRCRRAIGRAGRGGVAGLAEECEGVGDESLVLDDDVEDFSEDDERDVAGLGAEEDCGPESLLEHRVEGERSRWA